MKNKIRILREEKNLTQNELAEKSKLSLRTIQRIEAGNIAKGYTLKAVAEALETAPENLIGVDTEENVKTERAKIINLSALTGLVIPFGSVIFPLLLTYKTKDPKNKELGKNIVSVQIVLTVILSILMIICPFVQRALSIQFPLFIVCLIALMSIKLLVVLKNGISLNQKNDLHIKLKTSFL